MEAVYSLSPFNFYQVIYYPFKIVQRPFCPLHYESIEILIIWSILRVSYLYDYVLMQINKFICFSLVDMFTDSWFQLASREFKRNNCEP